MFYAHFLTDGQWQSRIPTKTPPARAVRAYKKFRWVIESIHVAAEAPQFYKKT